MPLFSEGQVKEQSREAKFDSSRAKAAGGPRSAFETISQPAILGSYCSRKQENSSQGSSAELKGFLLIAIFSAKCLRVTEGARNSDASKLLLSHSSNCQLEAGKLSHARREDKGQEKEGRGTERRKRQGRVRKDNNSKERGRRGQGRQYFLPVDYPFVRIFDVYFYPSACL